jgi:small GTP-binding protein
MVKKDANNTEEFRIVLLGKNKVGKSNLISRFCFNTFIEEHESNLEDVFRRLIIVDDVQSLFDISDSYGSQDTVKEQTINSSDGFLIIFSVVDRQSFEAVKKYVEQIKQVKHSKKPKAIYVIGNKCDLENERVVSAEEAKNLSKTLEIQYFEVSAKEKQNVEESFFGLAREIRKIRSTKPKKKGCTIA